MYIFILNFIFNLNKTKTTYAKLRKPEGTYSEFECTMNILSNPFICMFIFYILKVRNICTGVPYIYFIK